MKIDAHQHFWLYNEVEYGWIGDHTAELKRNFLPDGLKPLLQQTGIDGSIAVQARQTLEETHWLLLQAEEHSIIKGVVGWVELCSPNVNAQLDALANHPKLCGVRHVVHDEPDDRFMLRNDFIHGLRQLSKFNLTYDLLLFPKHLPVAIELLKQFPEQPFVLDHIAKPFIKGQTVSPWDQHIRELAQYGNVYCKISGMVTEADWHHWNYDDLVQYLDIIVESFGTKRLMIGSDWPVCTVAATYDQAMNIPFRYFHNFSNGEKSDIFGMNAMRFYNITE